MKKRLNCLIFGKGRKILISFICVSVLIGGFPFLWSRFQKAEAELGDPILVLPELEILQGNSLAAVSNPINPEPEVIRTISALITAYSSTPEETDESPFYTASGAHVRDGIVANNLLPLGTKIKIPNLYGDKIFVVEDRMNPKVGYFCFDIWFPSHQSAENFGVKTASIEVLD
ncbi:MAG: hypothetical protein PHF44_01450 [Candidatus Pacebacteria bacterium]|nr:hypothetical protein [Candidatus Paceibacterota bacterium]